MASVKWGLRYHAARTLEMLRTKSPNQSSAVLLICSTFGFSFILSAPWIEVDWIRCWIHPSQLLAVNTIQRNPWPTAKEVNGNFSTAFIIHWWCQLQKPLQQKLWKTCSRMEVYYSDVAPTATCLTPGKLNITLNALFARRRQEADQSNEAHAILFLSN